MHVQAGIEGFGSPTHPYIKLGNKIMWESKDGL